MVNKVKINIVKEIVYQSICYDLIHPMLLEDTLLKYIKHSEEETFEVETVSVFVIEFLVKYCEKNNIKLEVYNFGENVTEDLNKAFTPFAEVMKKMVWEK